MRVKIGLFACAIVMFSLHDSALAADAYLVRFDARGSVPGCLEMRWHDNVTFFNSGTSPASVKILGNSDGPAAITAPDSIVVLPNHAVALDDFVNGQAWVPASQLQQTVPYLLYILHIDVPPNVSVQSSDDIFIGSDCFPPNVVSDSYGHASLPVFTRLAVVGRPQVHLRTDLGVRDSRTNVTIYNAGDQAATAHIELRRLCDDSVADTRTVVIPPNTTLQTGGLIKGADTCGHPFTSGMRYTVVIVDQPSLSFVTTIATDHVVVLGGPTVDLSVAHGLDY